MDLAESFWLSPPLALFDPGSLHSIREARSPSESRFVNKGGSAVSARAFDNSWRQLPLLGEALII